MSQGSISNAVDILLIEDNPVDVMMTREALADNKVLNPLKVAEDGVVAMQYLRREGPYADVEMPGLIILDLNLPRKNGREVLQEIKEDPALKRIPIVVLTTSKSEEDILNSYELHANCYISKPVDFNKFLEVIRILNSFWFCVVTLPHEKR